MPRRAARLWQNPLRPPASCHKSSPGKISLQFESAELSLIGGREENQDRVRIVKGQESVLLIVIDGMGGHAHGAKAAEVAADTIGGAFKKMPQPLFDQLKEGGRLILPLARDAGRDIQELTRIFKKNGDAVRERHGGCRFVPLMGRFGWKE